MVNAKQEFAMDTVTKNNIENWLHGDYDEETKEQIREMLKCDPKQAVDAFYTSLSFGTGGLRGVMGPGSNRMNVYTVRKATQGLVNYLLHHLPNQKHSIIIGYDSRHNSPLFALEAARVMAGNGIKAYLFKQLRPTPLVSFSCRNKKCSAAIMITASHNPPEYNGYKVYWSDGGQVLPPHDKGIIEESKKISGNAAIKLSDVKSPLIQYIDQEEDAAYFDAIAPQQLYPQDNKNQGAKLHIVYTNLHGTGITLVPKALNRWGFPSVHPVPAQEKPDGDFPTVKSPNPEEKEALSLGIKQMVESNADILLATDPDADRMGVVVNVKGNPIMLTGNQIAVLALYHICSALENQGKMPPHAAFVKTIVTTELFKEIAEIGFGRSCFDVLPGFKYIAERIREWEATPHGLQYVFGGEESYGTLLGTHARDKDAVIACCLIAEAALQAKINDKTLLDTINAIYERFGLYYEKLLSIKYEESKEGHEKMASAMARLRKNPPLEIAGVKVTHLEDFEGRKKIEFKSNKTENISLPQSNVLLFWLSDGTKLVIRPSGTEPKIKIYCDTHLLAFQSIEEARQKLKKQAKLYLDSLKSLL